MDQNKLATFLKAHIRSHIITVSENKIHGKRLIPTRSFSGFRITCLKHGKGYSLTTFHNRTVRYDTAEELFAVLGSFTDFNVPETVL